MDPNEALAKMRAALDAYHRGQEVDSGDWIGHLQEVAQYAEALDEWLSRDGFLPNDWRSDDEKAGKA